MSWRAELRHHPSPWKCRSRTPPGDVVGVVIKCQIKQGVTTDSHVRLATDTRELESGSTTHINIMITLTQDRLTRRGLASPQEIRSTKDPDGQHHNGSPFPGTLCLAWEGGPRLCRHVQYDRTGRHLTSGTIPTSVSYSP
jgi:hypothetical protein